MTQSGTADQQSTDAALTPKASGSDASAPRPALELRSARSNLPTYSNRRPVDPSPVQVSHTVSIAGRRPVMSSQLAKQNQVDLTKAPSYFNRPIAPNTTEDASTLMGYLD
ncbi:MAG: hypothetical protein AAGF24_09135 [Cyanobacteria bacterium P01_H01_bin.121]